ncbi:hypothetical protein R1flu_017152, partial [Riccia fluitans]
KKIATQKLAEEKKEKVSDLVRLENIHLMDQMLARNDEVQSSTNPTIYRCSMSLIPRHSKQYCPRYIALGLYNEDIDVMESASSIIDKAKLQMKMDIASIFRATVKKTWMEICNFIVKEPEDMKRMYDDDCPVHDVQAIRNILTLDAAFITSVLYSLWDVYHTEDHSALRFHGIAKVGREREAVILAVDSVDLIESSAPSEARVTLEELPMNGRHSKRGKEFELSGAAPVLKGMVEVACGLRALQDNKEENFDLRGKDKEDTPIATVTQLRRAGLGIKFSEENCYSNAVIELSQLGSDREVADIFNSLLNNSNEIPLSSQWTRLRKEIHRFYSSEKRQLWVEFVDAHFGRAWVTVSVVAAIALLVMTFLQTLYTMKGYYAAGEVTEGNGANPGQRRKANVNSLSFLNSVF